MPEKWAPNYRLGDIRECPRAAPTEMGSEIIANLATILNASRGAGEGASAASQSGVGFAVFGDAIPLKNIAILTLADDAWWTSGIVNVTYGLSVREDR
jgi:hypothetical protein